MLASSLDVVGLEDCPATLGVNVDGGRKDDEEGEDEKEVNRLHLSSLKSL